MRRLALAALTGTAALGAARGASAQAPPAARLAYVRGAGAERCPDAAALRDAVAARLGYDPFQSDAAMAIEATIRRVGRTLEARIEARDAAGVVTGARTLTSARNDCGELASAMALAISIAIDALRLAPPRAAAPVPPRPPPPAAPAALPVRPEPSPVPPPPRAAPPPPAPPAATVRVVVGGGALVALGTAPAATAGAIAFAGLRGRAVSVALEGRADLPAATRTARGSEVETGLLLATLVPCAHLGVVGLCALGGVGQLRAAARDATGAAGRQDASLFAVVGARAAVEVPVHRALALRIHADLVVPLTRATVSAGPELVWTTPTFAASLGAGLAVSFR